MSKEEVEELKQLNKSELVQLLADLYGIRASRSYAKVVLAKALVTGKAPKNLENPFDPIRNQIIAFLRKYEEELKSQLDLKCTQNCYDHSDMQVLACWRNSQKVLESEGD